MSKLVWWLAAFLLIAAFAGCDSDEVETPPPGADGLNVVTSTTIVAALAREVAGEHASITSLTHPGSDPHVYEPSPGDVRTISNADLVLLNGLNLDDHLRDDVQAVNPDVPVVAVTSGIDLIHSEHDEAEDESGDEHEHGDVDPHVWMDPLRVKVMVDNIAAALSEADPERASDYRDASERYKLTLDETHEQISALISQIPPGNRKIVTNHDALAYFAQRHGLEVVGTVFPGISTEAEPSARDIANLVDLIESQDVKAIFAERIVNSSIAEQVAADTGVRIVTGLYTGQVGEDGSGAETVHGMLLTNAKLIRDALV